MKKWTLLWSSRATPRVRIRGERSFRWNGRIKMRVLCVVLIVTGLRQTKLSQSQKGSKKKTTSKLPSGAGMWPTQAKRRIEWPPAHGRQRVAKQKQKAARRECSSTQVNVQRTDANLGRPRA